MLNWNALFKPSWDAFPTYLLPSGTVVSALAVSIKGQDLLLSHGTVRGCELRGDDETSGSCVAVSVKASGTVKGPWFFSMPRMSRLTRNGRHHTGMAAPIKAVYDVPTLLTFLAEACCKTLVLGSCLFYVCDN